LIQDRFSKTALRPGLSVFPPLSHFLLSLGRYRAIHLKMFHEAGIWDGREFQRKVLA
jgi:hypothetical protein